MKLFSIKLWRVLMVISLSLLVVFCVGFEVALSYKTMINNALGTSSYEFVEVETEEEINTEYFSSSFSSSEEIAEYGKQVSEEVEAEGLVLLKNKSNALPLSAGDSVSCVLQGSVDIGYGAGGSGAIDASKYVNLKTPLEEVGLDVNDTLWNFYTTDSNATDSDYLPSKELPDRRATLEVYKTNTLPWDLYSEDAKNSIADSEVALCVITRASGEGIDVSTIDSDGLDGSYISLTEEEQEILQRLTTMKKDGDIDKIVVLLNTALAFRTDFLHDSSTIDVDACMWVGNVGIGGLYAVADALVGNVNPSGKLSDTYVKDSFASPAMASWSLNSNGCFAGTYSNASDYNLNDTQKYFGAYVDGIYVGYRYYETRYEDVVLGASDVGSYDYSATVSYPFGHGLSYTEFEFSDYAVAKNADGNYEVSVKVTNTGSKPGKEVVQVYLQKPYTEYDKANGVEKASVELVGFAKTEELAGNGGNEIVTVTVNKEDFKTYDEYGYKTYILEEGEYYLAIGDNAHDALNNILALKGKSTADGMTDNGNANFAKLVGEDIMLDYTTYAVSMESGEAVEVTNRLDFCNINKYEGAGDNEITYLSRKNWSGTWPTTAVKMTVTDQMNDDLASNKAYEEDPEATMPTYGAQNGLSLVMLRSTEETPIPFDDPLWDQLLDQMSFADQAYLMSAAGYGSVGVTSVTLPPAVAKDGPNGVSASKESISFPSEGIWASSFNLEIISKVGDALAEDARDIGATGMYLPGVNIHRTPFDGRTHEYFSEDPFLSGKAVEAEIKAVQAKGVLPYVKHFVFNEEEDKRNGICIWLNEQSARELYLKTFEYAVAPSRGNSHALMTSFNRAGCLWTSASEVLVQDILRGEFGFDGIVLTDYSDGNGIIYMTYLDGILSGTDMYLGSGSETAFDEYKNSATFATKMRESCHRILYVMCNYSASMNGYSASTKIVQVLTWWEGLLISVIITFAVIGAGSIALMILSMLKNKKNN